MYTAYDFTGASFKVGDGDWIPLSLPNSIEYDIAALQSDWDTIVHDFPMLDYSVECKLEKYVPLLRLFTHKPTIARRKIWRYMERCGL